MPTDPLKVYDLGQQGVQLVASPLHQEPAKEVIRAQNAIYDKDSRAGGLRKRGGLAKLNSVALNSGATVNGALFVAFADPASPLSIGVRRGLYLNISGDLDGATVGGVLYATALTDFSDAVSLARVPPYPEPRLLSDIPINANGYFGSVGVGLPGRIYFASDEVLPEVWRWDGLAASRVARIPAPPQDHAHVGSQSQCRVAGVFVFDGTVYVTTLDGDTTDAPLDFGRVFELDPDNEAVQQVGLSTWGKHTGAVAQGHPVALEWFAGRLWAATATADSSIGPRILSIRPGVDEDWTLEETFTVGHHFTGLKVYKGELYATTGHATNGVASVIRKRTTDGTWSTVRTNPSTATANYFGGMAVINGLLLVVQADDGAADNTPHIFSYDGTNFTDEVDVRTEFPPGAAGSVYSLSDPLVYDGAVYYALSDASTAGGRIIRSTDGSTFTQVLDTVGDPPAPEPPPYYHHFLGVLRD